METMHTYIFKKINEFIVALCEGSLKGCEALRIKIFKTKIKNTENKNKTKTCDALRGGSQRRRCEALRIKIQKN